MPEETKAVSKEEDENMNNCPTRLLADFPADHDAFGSHQRVAKAVADLIKKEEGGKAIALIGSWGSGKSTVVELLKKELQKDSESKNTTIFVFDTWEHREDPLRRSFLERLYQFLVQQGWAKEGQWDEELDKIRKRREEIDTETQPVLTKLGKWLAASLIFVPVGYVLLSAGLSVDQLNRWLVGIGSFFIALPFLIVGYAWRKRLLRNKSVKEGGDQSDQEKEQDESFLLLFINRTREVIRTKATRTPDPTSIEFQDLFIKVLNDALSGQRRLVVAIDNLDRIEEEEARSIWATMRAFFEVHDQNPPPEWLNGFWLLVPFAPDTPSRLWQEKAQKPLKEKDEGKSTNAEEKGSQQKSLADEFIDKTFQARFYVPLPVISDWKGFFKGQLKEAFPKHFERHEEDLYALYRIFESKRACKHRPPTPREIKLFINQVGSYHRIWQDEIPLSVQALYVLYVSKRIEEQGPERVLLNKDELIKDVEQLFNKESRLQEYLAALYFNVDVDKAMQVLIGDEVREALYSGDGKKIKEVQVKVDPQAFLTVVDQEIFNELNEWISNEPPALAKAALALRDLKQDEPKEWERIWKQLVDAARKAKWADLYEKVGEGLATILRKSGDDHEAVAREILANVSEPSAPAKEGEAPERQDVNRATNWTKGLVQLLDEVYQSDHRDLLKEFQIPGDAPFYVEVMRSLAEGKVENQRLAEYFVPKAEPSKIVQQLTTLCQRGKLSDPYAYAIQFMLNLRIDWPWQQLIQEIQQRRLNAPNTLQPPELKGCLRALLYLERGRIQSARSGLQQLSTQGHLLHHLHHANASKDQEAVGLCMLPILEYIPSGRTSALPGQAGQGQYLYERQVLDNPPDNLVKSMANLTCEFRKGDKLLQTVAKEVHTQRIVADIFQEAAHQGRAAECLSSSGVVEHCEVLLKMVRQSDVLPDDQMQSLIEQLVEDGGLLRELEERDFSIGLADLYRRAHQACKDSDKCMDSNKKKSFEEFLVRSLKKVSNEEWLEALKQESDLLKIIIALIEDNVPIGLSKSFHDALLDHVRIVLQGDAYPSELEDQWDRILGALEEDWKQTFLRNLRDKLIDASDKDLTKPLSLYGRALIESEVLMDKEKSDDIVRRLFSPILGRSNSEEVEWLAKTLDNNRQVFQRSRKQSQEAFRSALRDAWGKATDEQAKVHIKSIAKVIGLELKPTPEPDEPESKAPGGK